VTWSFHTEDPADGRILHAAPPLDLKPHHHTGLSSQPCYAVCWMLCPWVGRYSATVRTPHLPEGSRHGRPGCPEPWSAESEGQDVRQYRYLMRTAPLDALEAAHGEALTSMTSQDRLKVLHAVRDGLVAGLRASPDDVPTIAHLLTIGERRLPGAFLRSCDTTTLQQLARGVIVAEATFGLFGGYDAWDGEDPTPGQDRDDSQFAEGWHARLGTRDGTGGRSYDGWSGA
jgi:hypothetical protein